MLDRFVPWCRYRLEEVQQREWLVEERQQSWGQKNSLDIQEGHLVWQHRHGAVKQAGVEGSDSEVDLEEVVASVGVEGMEEEVHGPWVEAYRAAVDPGSHSPWVEEERWVVRDAAEADVAKEIPSQAVVVEVHVLVPSSMQALFPSLEAEAPVPSWVVPGQAWALSPCYSLSPSYYYCLFLP
jgi:hypothetical protein